mmetsp:Transcript_20673/g.46524  ORF Transcript_20673/g.46524 Transcript_20673/m.46524 type:complete len:95 (-) Transcript_20673:1102-1386(-)
MFSIAQWRKYNPSHHRHDIILYKSEHVPTLWGCSASLLLLSSRKALSLRDLFLEQYILSSSTHLGLVGFIVRSAYPDISGICFGSLPVQVEAIL